VYRFLLLLHIMGAVVWVGGAVAVQILGVRVERSDDPSDLPRLARHVEALGNVAFVPAATLLLVTGGVMTAQAWAFDQVWIMIAVVLWLVSALAGAVYLAPRAKRVVALFEAEGPASVAARRLMSRLFVVSRVELLSFAVILVLMVYKPGA
jgi:uncharacterized membrane protein